MERKLEWLRVLREDKKREQDVDVRQALDQIKAQANHAQQELDQIRGQSNKVSGKLRDMIKKFEIQKKTSANPSH